MLAKAEDHEEGLDGDLEYCLANESSSEEGGEGYQEVAA
jgi:hypothetical protein